MGEIPNLSYHRCRLLVKALNRAKTKKEAATLVGVSERTIHRMIQEHDIDYDPKTKTYKAKALTV